jgi:hypothetical protein
MRTVLRQFQGKGMVWPLLLAWLIYSTVALGWYIHQNPGFLNAFCRTT